MSKKKPRRREATVKDLARAGLTFKLKPKHAEPPGAARRDCRYPGDEALEIARQLEYFQDGRDVTGLDKGIEPYVLLLRAGGVETYESCEGYHGHAYAEPTVAFHGGHAEGLRALSWALEHGMPVSELRRVWSVLNGESTGPHWHLTFTKQARALVDEVPA